MTSSYTQALDSQTQSGTPSDSATAGFSVTASATGTATDTAAASPTVTPSATKTLGVTGFNPASAPDSGGFTITVTGSEFPAGAQIAVAVDGNTVVLTTSEQTTGGVETLTAIAPAFGIAVSTTVTVVDSSVSGTTPLDGWSGTMALMKATASATPSSGPAKVIASEPFPNPWSGAGPFTIAVELAGPADDVVLKIYTKAFVLVGSYDAGPQGEGWNHLVPPSSLLASVPSDLYFYTVSAKRNGQGLKPTVGRIYVLRTD